MGDEPTRYVVLVDVVGSRDIEDRAGFESQLDSALAAVNDAEREHLATPFTQMKGIDEFGAVLETIAPLPDVVSDLLNRIHPVFARFAVASGDVDVGAGRDTVARMDGPAFHRASELLADIESEGLYVGVDTGRATDPLVADALTLLLVAREDLTARQVEVVRAYERHGTQAKAAEALGLRQQTVSKTLQRADHRRRATVRERIGRTLEDMYE